MAETTQCKSCNRDIVWMGTYAGKKMPVDADTVPDTFEEGDIFDKRKGMVSHFDTCPNASQHRAGGRSSAPTNQEKYDSLAPKLNIALAALRDIAERSKEEGVVTIAKTAISQIARSSR